MQTALPMIAGMQQKIWLQKEKRERRKRLITEILIDYAKNSTLHGLRYTTESDLSIFEKVFWLSTFILSALMCGYLITNVYNKWNTSPVIVTVGERMVSASSIPFPAVTICPQMKIKASIYNFTYYYTQRNNMNLTAEELEELSDMTLLCRSDGFETDRVTNYTITDRIKKVSPKKSETLSPCAFIRLDHCEFTNTYTSEGLCFTYNNLAGKELFRNGVVRSVANRIRSTGWSFENGYNLSVQFPYPARGQLKHEEPHMMLALTSSIEDEDYSCNELTNGFKIYLSHPADVPRTAIYSYFAYKDQITSLAIKATIFNSPKSLINYSVEKRQCYFPEERYLRYYKLYTATNCQMECFSNMTVSMCGCVKFYMPRRRKDKIRLCNLLDDRECVYHARTEMDLRELRAEDNSSIEACRCLPTCNSIEYSAEVLKRDMPERYMKVNKRLSLLHLYYQKPKFIAMHRSELFGVTDFLANIGGLLGVFLGFSFLSLVEMLYFIFIRIGFALKNQN